MTRRLSTSTDANAAAPTVSADATAIPVRRAASSALSRRRHGPSTPQDLEDHYVAARDAWAAAMRAANSGRPADLAALALAQEAYELAVAERQRWHSGPHVAIPIEPETSQRDLSAIIQHELAWRKVRAAEEKPIGILGRIRRRFRR